jgi:hypothetical protein
MLSGVTGGLLPPPPQASSNPDRKKLDTKARELNRITSSQVSGKLRFRILRLWKESRGPELLLLEMLVEPAYGMARRRNAGNDLPIRGQAEIRYSRALLLARIMWKLKSRWIHGAEAGRTSRDSREIVARNLPERQAHGRRPSGPAFVCFADMQPTSAIPPRRKLAGCEAHDVDIPWDIDPIAGPVPEFVVIRTKCGRSREGTQAPPEAIDVAVIQKRFNFQMGLFPGRHR